MKKKLNGLRFALYVRKSTESEDRQMQSISDQVTKLEELAKQEGLNVIRTYKESKSAKAPRQRQQFNQMLEDVRNGEIDGILCWALNRLSRNNVDSSEIQWELQEGTLSCIKTPEKDYNPNDSGLVFTLESAMSTEFIRDLKKNINRGMQSKLDKGILPCLPPLGYANCSRTKTIIPDGKYFPLIRKMWELMLTGTYTPPKLVAYVNKEWGFRTPIRTKTGGKPLSRSSIYKMFENEFYKGVITWNGKKYKGIHKKLVTPAEFERVQ
jgi:site-specific DNA recombinase